MDLIENGYCNVRYGCQRKKKTFVIKKGYLSNFVKVQL